MLGPAVAGTVGFLMIFGTLDPHAECLFDPFCTCLEAWFIIILNTLRNYCITRDTRDTGKSPRIFGGQLALRQHRCQQI